MHEQLHDYIARQRWFGGKGREFDVTDLRALPLGINVVTVAFADGEQALYQLPLSSYDAARDDLAYALVGEWDAQWHYDAVYDRDATHPWLEAIADGSRGDGLVAHRLDGHEFDLDSHSTLFTGEQSNSSMAFGEDSMFKLFRRLTPGVNPDIEIHEALTRAGSTHVAALYGWLEAPMFETGLEAGGVVQLGLLQQFLRTSSEGWELALASVRNLFAEEDLHPEDVGGDFASEAHRLGVAVAEVHATLREVLPTGAVPGDNLAQRMSTRLREASFVPELASRAPALQSVYDALGEAEVPVQRIHADLHLGQTLRTSLGWKLVDFEGEPAQALALRQLPDSPWRDVAGMLRSFDYAARVVQADISAAPDLAGQLNYRADEWVARNRAAFLDGYQEATSPFSDRDRVLIRAFEIDKAVYEVAYEARNRPSWIGIPLNALARLVDRNAT